MKKLMTAILACALLLSLCACDKAQQETPNATTAATTAATVATTTPDPTEATQQAQNLIDLAKSCIDKPVSELYALIGQPDSSDYAPSCMGDGEDGNLYYDGFIVYTYKEGDTETVHYVE